MIINERKKSYLTFKEMMVTFAKRPKVNYLWSGIKEKSFGLVFGPSKSGKTIFCENLAMSLAIGRKDFFGYSLSGEPKKVLFIGLEEYWEMRMDRNSSQFESLENSEKELLEENYLYQSIDFNRYIHQKEDWKLLSELIFESGAEIVFIDSITRMNHGSLEDSKTAEEIMQRLRNICYDLSITLICVHHTPKMYDKPITMDSIKGSSVFAQESDFAIGVNRTHKGYRYIKNIFFRYATPDDLVVKEFEIQDDYWLNYFAESEESKVLERSDRRRDTNKREAIVEFFNKNSTSTFSTKELVEFFKSDLSIQERQVKNYLSSLVENQEIQTPKKGIYVSRNYVDKNEGRNG